MATPLERELSRRKRKPAQPPPGGLFANNPAAPGLSDPLQNPAPGGGAYGLTNFAGGGTENLLAAFEAAKQRHQSQALNPQFQPTPLVAPNSPHATASPYGSPPPQLPAQSYADQWKNLIPTGPQFSSFGPFSDPRGGPVDGPVPSQFGNVQREIGNKVFEGVGTAIDRTAGEVRGIASAPFKLAHQLFTPGVQLEEEQKAAKQQAEASQPAVAPPQIFHLPNAQGPATSGPGPQPTVAAPGATPAATPGTQSAATAPAATTPWTNASAPAQGGDPLARSRQVIGGMEGAGSGGYSATGPVNPSGDRAYGRYQVMGANIPSWTAQALGRAMTPEEFIANPKAQDDTFNAIFGGYLRSGSQADAASRWFTGHPLAGREGSTDILGTTAGDYVTRYMHAMGLPGLPPKMESFQQAVPPGQPNPVDRPLPVGPDYTQTNSWLNQAAPQPVDPAAQRQMMFNQLLSGIAGANAEVDTRGPGGTARLLAALGGGAARGKASGEERARAENEAFKEKQQAYAGDRAGFAQTQANVTADTKNKVSETQWANMTDDQRTDFINRTSSFEVGQANQQGQFNARQANKENLYKYGEGLVGAGQPSLKFMGNYIAEINPDGSLGSIHDLHGSDSASIKFRAEIAQGHLGEEARLHQRYQEFADANDENGLKRAIMDDVVASGAAPVVFQANYDEAMKQANAIMARGQMGGSGDVVHSKQIRDGIVSNLLWQMSYGDESWLPIAAQAGNPGAAMLQPGGQ